MRSSSSSVEAQVAKDDVRCLLTSVSACNMLPSAGSPRADILVKPGVMACRAAGGPRMPGRDCSTIAVAILLDICNKHAQAESSSSSRRGASGEAVVHQSCTLSAPQHAAAEPSPPTLTHLLVSAGVRRIDVRRLARIGALPADQAVLQLLAPAAAPRPPGLYSYAIRDLEVFLDCESDNEASITESEEDGWDAVVSDATSHGAGGGGADETFHSPPSSSAPGSVQAEHGRDSNVDDASAGSDQREPPAANPVPAPLLWTSLAVALSLSCIAPPRVFSALAPQLAEWLPRRLRLPITPPLGLPHNTTAKLLLGGRRRAARCQPEAQRRLAAQRQVAVLASRVCSLEAELQSSHDECARLASRHLAAAAVRAVTVAQDLPRALPPASGPLALPPQLIADVMSHDLEERATVPVAHDPTLPHKTKSDFGSVRSLWMQLIASRGAEQQSVIERDAALRRAMLAEAEAAEQRSVASRHDAEVADLTAQLEQERERGRSNAAALQLALAAVERAAVPPVKLAAAVEAELWSAVTAAPTAADELRAENAALLAKLEASASSAAGEVARLEAAVSAAQHELDAAHSAHSLEVGSLQQQLAAQQQTLAAVQGELATTSSAAQSAEAEAERGLAEAAALRHQLAQAVSTSTRLSDESHVLRRAVADVGESAASALQDLAQHSDAQASCWNERLRAVHDEASHLTGQLQIAQCRNDELLATQQQLQEAQQAQESLLQAECERSRQLELDLTTSRGAAASELRRGQDEVRSLSAQLAQLQEEAASTASASAAAVAAAAAAAIAAAAAAAEQDEAVRQQAQQADAAQQASLQEKEQKLVELNKVLSVVCEERELLTAQVAALMATLAGEQDAHATAKLHWAGERDSGAATHEEQIRLYQTQLSDAAAQLAATTDRAALAARQRDEAQRITADQRIAATRANAAAADAAAAAAQAALERDEAQHFAAEQRSIATRAISDAADAAAGAAQAARECDEAQHTAADLRIAVTHATAAAAEAAAAAAQAVQERDEAQRTAADLRIAVTHATEAAAQAARERDEAQYTAAEQRSAATRANAAAAEAAAAAAQAALERDEAQHTVADLRSAAREATAAAAQAALERDEAQHIAAGQQSAATRATADAAGAVAAAACAEQRADAAYVRMVVAVALTRAASSAEVSEAQATGVSAHATAHAAFSIASVMEEAWERHLVAQAWDLQSLLPPMSRLLLSHGMGAAANAEVAVDTLPIQLHRQVVDMQHHLTALRMEASSIISALDAGLLAAPGPLPATATPADSTSTLRNQTPSPTDALAVPGNGLSSTVSHPSVVDAFAGLAQSGFAPHSLFGADDAPAAHGGSRLKDDASAHVDGDKVQAECVAAINSAGSVCVPGAALPSVSAISERVQQLQQRVSSVMLHGADVLRDLDSPKARPSSAISTSFHRACSLTQTNPLFDPAMGVQSNSPHTTAMLDGSPIDRALQDVSSYSPRRRAVSGGGGELTQLDASPDPALVLFASPVRTTLPMLGGTRGGVLATSSSQPALTPFAGVSSQPDSFGSNGLGPSLSQSTLATHLEDDDHIAPSLVTDEDHFQVPGLGRGNSAVREVTQALQQLRRSVRGMTTMMLGTETTKRTLMARLQTAEARLQQMTMLGAEDRVSTSGSIEWTPDKAPAAAPQTPIQRRVSTGCASSPVKDSSSPLFARHSSSNLPDRLQSPAMVVSPQQPPARRSATGASASNGKDAASQRRQLFKVSSVGRDGPLHR